MIVYAFCTFALAWIIGHATISHPTRALIAQQDTLMARWLLSLLECCGCVGFHLGWAAFMLKLTPSELATWWQASLFTATACLVLARFTGLLDRAENS